MRVLIIGGGGREHALAWRLSREPGVTSLACAPGNAGIGSVARLFPVDAADPEALVALAEREAIDLTVVGPELPLDRGVVDRFRAAGRRVFGPPRAAAQLECSKVFAKGFMARHGIPTARYRVCGSAAAARDVIASGEFGFPVVLKADGLAAGKGVVVAADRAEADAAIRAAMEEQRFGDAGARLVIEECLVGPEVSFFALCDGTRAIPITSAQDHKRIFDNDRGPNTGGMGAFAPSPLVDAAAEAAIVTDVIDPVLRGMRAEGTEYRGFLYAGLMMTCSGPKVIEYNVRFGIEAQAVMPLIDGELLPLWSPRPTAGSAASRRAARCCLGCRGPRVAGYPARSRPGSRSRSRRGQPGSRRHGLSCRHRDARQSHRHRRRSRADRRRRGRQLSGSDRSCISGRVSDIVRGNAIPSRYRHEGSITKSPNPKSNA
jgi:phosphoribosylamine--glycine ligase